MPAESSGGRNDEDLTQGFVARWRIMVQPQADGVDDMREAVLMRLPESIFDLGSE